MSRPRSCLARNRQGENRIGTWGDADPSPPSLHDFHVAELEATLLADSRKAPASGEAGIRHDDPGEPVRALWIIALTWLIPLLLVSATLAVFGTSFDRAVYSLLRFSALALSVPLGASLLALLLRIFKRRRNRKGHGLPGPYGL
ncbi:MAG: hypothetical protein IPP82_05120 [Xanthomonadales bacterium]|nr:hypothetical protein [Xanthomonadales bacterium]